MKVTVLGSSGSLAQPGNPASGYLIETHDGTSIVMDMGPGVLAVLQQMHNPSDAHVIFSHLHPDHCMDFPSLMVWRRYHPTMAATTHNICLGPAATPVFLGRASSDHLELVDDMGDTFDFFSWQPGHAEHIGAVTITPYPAIHPIEAFSLRVEADDRVLAYSGDTAYTEELIECARNADLFLCEGTWGTTTDGKPADMHLSGAEAGEIARRAGAKRLTLIHIPPWADPKEALQAAQSEFDGPVDISFSGQVITL